jgi:hypothetical protein
VIVQGGATREWQAMCRRHWKWKENSAWGEEGLQWRAGLSHRGQDQAWQVPG